MLMARAKGSAFFSHERSLKLTTVYKFQARSRTLFDFPCAIRIVNYLKEEKRKQGLLWGVTKPRISTLHRGRLTFVKSFVVENKLIQETEAVSHAFVWSTVNQTHL